MYEPGRTQRFDYIWEVMVYIEQNQCSTCAFSKKAQDPKNEPHSSEYPMCFDVEAELIAETPVECLDELPDGSVACSIYRDAELAEQEHPDQSKLF